MFLVHFYLGDFLSMLRKFLLALNTLAVPYSLQVSQGSQRTRGWEVERKEPQNMFYLPV